jgi:peptidoglycan/LPS O-acetylase OafA/YrhL
MTVPLKSRNDVYPFARILAVFREGTYELLNPPAGNVPGLDVLRSLAIVLVVSGHYYGEFSAARGSTLAIGRFPFFYFAWTGVDLFFVLSGYLIGRQLWRELTVRNTINIPRFLLKRGLRIWPYYFVFVAWSISISSKPISSFLPDLFFLSNYFPSAVAGSWSLSTEEQFYIFVPVLLYAVSTLISARRQFLVVVGLLVALPFIRYLTLSAYQGEITHEVAVRIIQLPFHTHADGLLAGLLLSWLSILKPDHLKPLPFLRNLIWPTTLVVAGLLLRSFDRLFGLSALALIFGGMTLFVLRDRSALRKLFNKHIFYLTSRLSYGMYLNHFPILAFAVPLLVAARISNSAYLNFFIGYPLMVFASMVVAAATFILIESPFLQLRERWLAAKSGASEVKEPDLKPAFKPEQP